MSIFASLLSLAIIVIVVLVWKLLLPRIADADLRKIAEFTASILFWLSVVSAIALTLFYG